MSGRRIATLGAIAVVLLTPLCARADAASTPTLRASSTHALDGQRVTLSGQASDAPAGSTVELEQSPYPFASYLAAATTTTAADGSFAFTVAPDRDTRYQAVIAGGPSSQTVEIDVEPKASITVQALPLGRAQVVIVLFHPSDVAFGGAPVRWSFTSGRTTATAKTTAYRLSPYVAVLRAVVPLPAGHFSWSACLTAPGDQALLTPARPAGCTGLGYAGDGSLPAGFPSPAAVSRAAAYLAGRAGTKAFAVIDSQGRLSGVHVHWTFNTASVVKAMLLTAYLRRLDARGQRYVDAYSNSFLYPMIHVSDNDAATHCWSIVGDGGLWSVAGAAGMSDFSVAGLWGTAMLSPADQARFFFEMDSLIPREFVGYARFLLSTIDSSQSWAIPAVARQLGYRVFFKDGSEPYGSGQLVHQVARLEGHGRRLALAVMTDGDPTMQYGIDTIQGVAAALLR